MPLHELPISGGRWVDVPVLTYQPPFLGIYAIDCVDIMHPIVV